MSTVVKKAPSATGLTSKAAAPDYTVADLSLADWGRKEIAIAEHEMPGLMAIRRKYAAEPAAQGRPHRRQPAHDHPDGRADRDAAGPGRRHPLGELQHLLDAGPRRRRHRRAGHARLRQEGRDPRRVLGLHAPHLQLARRRHAQPHPRRRRRRHPAGPPRLRRREGSRRSSTASPSPRRKPSCCASIKRTLPDHPHFYSNIGKQHRRRSRGDDDRRPPPLRARARGHAAASRRSTSTTA